MEWLGGFVLGFIADLFRSVAMPASTEWINRRIPSTRKRANVEENKLTLEIMERLKSLGKNPDLAKHARGDADQFMLVLTSQQQAFVDNAIEVIDSTYMAQAEMNNEAVRRAEVAEKQMERAMVALELSGWMSEAQTAALRETQQRWQEYAESQAAFVAAEHEGGSMAPLIYASELENATVSRTGELKRMLEDMRGRYSE
ncbi:lysozyme inhibitor LprI family protein [Sinorhizobium meliloti]|uniref:lysozyme inhibitor LprI family protein n=1 Tax=Rhizobium meliloti TaxID=382 RepID=UPI000FDA5AFB|nr:lysozyme inhibitor LprI family protein [Sinorhizobium meliloti]RVG95990.1 DUF1311 domain-containing protein [Sinorhizobium meliloti]WQP07818.1 lysozyme inhibitor LprI family protein [Sinorhizobium meliloti]WQP21223.1 lysozyme inhibitor LprI family protein [Sinorhizobium meliloti]WQP34638.1 lysozyme inhibitor LprI family protein [Sinorhizobium meliloti]